MDERFGKAEKSMTWRLLEIMHVFGDMKITSLRGWSVVKQSIIFDSTEMRKDGTQIQLKQVEILLV